VSQKLQSSVQEFGSQLVVGAADLDPVNDGNGLVTPFRPGLVEAGQCVSGDPEDCVADWHGHSGPCGIIEFPEERGIFEPAEDQYMENPDALLTSETDATRRRIDIDADAWNELFGFETKGLR